MSEYKEVKKLTNKGLEHIIHSDGSEFWFLEDTFNIWIQEKIAPNTQVITHQGYLINLKEEYEFFKEHVGNTSKYDFYTTQAASDSIKVQFSTYEFRVGKLSPCGRITRT